MMKGKTDMISVNAFESRLQREILDLFGEKVAVYRRCFLNERGANSTLVSKLDCLLSEAEVTIAI